MKGLIVLAVLIGIAWRKRQARAETPPDDVYEGAISFGTGTPERQGCFDAGGNPTPCPDDDWR